MTKLSYYVIEKKESNDKELLYGCNVNEIILLCKKFHIHYDSINIIQLIDARKIFTKEQIENARLKSKNNWDRKKIKEHKRLMSKVVLL
jgi:hypothetical protein